MFLKRVKLENVRCFAELDLDIDLQGGDNQKWTLLLGQNGTGKSTILRAIALVLGGSDALPHLIGRPDHWVRNGAEQARVSLEVETKQGEVRELSLSFGPKTSMRRLVHDSLESLAPLNNALEHTSRNYFTVGYGASRRLRGAGIGGEENSSLHPRARSVWTLFDRDAELNPLESWAMELDYRQEDGLEIVSRVLGDFLPGMTFAGIDKKRRQLMFDTPDGLVPLQQLSEGYQNVAAWVGDMLYRITETFEDYKSPLAARGLLLIDELDLHLHPIWQRRLIAFLNDRLPNFQLVVTSHSVVTAQQAGPNALHILKREKDSVHLDEFTPDPGEMLISQLLMTDAFGFDTDESFALEARKDRHARLQRKQKTKRGLSRKETAEFEELGRQLAGRSLSAPSQPVLHREQVALMEAIKNDLERRGS